MTSRDRWQLNFTCVVARSVAPAVLLDAIRDALAARQLRVSSLNGGRLAFQGPGMRSTNQDPLFALSVGEIEVSGDVVRVEATAGGFLELSRTLVRMFIMIDAFLAVVAIGAALVIDWRIALFVPLLCLGQVILALALRVAMLPSVKARARSSLETLIANAAGSVST